MAEAEAEAAINTKSCGGSANAPEHFTNHYNPLCNLSTNVFLSSRVHRRPLVRKNERTSFVGYTNLEEGNLNFQI